MSMVKFMHFPGILECFWWLKKAKIWLKQAVANPDLGASGLGAVLFCLPCRLPSVISSFSTQNKRGAGPSGDFPRPATGNASASLCLKQASALAGEIIQHMLSKPFDRYCSSSRWNLTLIKSFKTLRAYLFDNVLILLFKFMWHAQCSLFLSSIYFFSHDSHLLLFFLPGFTIMYDT